MAGHELPKSMETRIEAIQESDGLGRLMKARDDLLDWMESAVLRPVSAKSP